MLFRPIKFSAGIIFAIIFSQLPEFSQQYQQRLGGKLDELSTVIEDFTEDANSSGQIVDDAIDTMQESGEDLIVNRGERISEYFSDFEQLKNQFERFTNGGLLQQIAVIVLSFDTDLVIATYEVFQPAIPVSIEGILLTGVGFIVGYLFVGILFFIVKLFLRLIFRRRKIV